MLWVSKLSSYDSAMLIITMYCAFSVQRASDPLEAHWAVFTHIKWHKLLYLRSFVCYHQPPVAFTVPI